MASPSSVKMRIMPTLRPSNPRRLLRLMIFSSPRAFQLGSLCFERPTSIGRTDLGARRGVSRTLRAMNASLDAPCGKPAIVADAGSPATCANREGLLLQLDLDVDAGRQVQLHQRVDRL